LASADFDRNGLPDVVALDQNHANVAYDQGGSFTPDTGNPYQTPPSQSPDLGVGDFDRDGNPDFAAVGQDSLTGAAAGDVFLNLAPDTTTTTLATSPNPSAEGQSVTFTATVTPTVPPFPAGTQPTGTVTFSVDGTDVGTVAVVNGTATFSTSTLAVGSHPAVARYSGHPAFRPGVS